MLKKELKDEFLSGSGIPIKRVYTGEDMADIDPDRHIGQPGEPPFTRGIYPSMYRSRLWTIRRYSGHGTPEETNELYKREYELGQTGFSIAFDPPTEGGLDSDDHRVAADVGASGVSVDSLLDMELMFEGLPIDKAATAIISTMMTSPALHAMYFVMAEKRGLKFEELDGTTQTDIMTSLGCLYLADQVAPRHQLRFGIDLIEWCIENAPRWHPVSVDSYSYREQGIDAVQELGLLLATAISYLEEERSRGRVSMDNFCRPFTFDMGCHNDFFEEIAKFRAGRRMWHTITKERYGVTDPKAMQFRFHAQTAGCTHTYQQPLNNLVRIAFQTLACALGGAQSVHANGYDEGICLPTEQSMLLSIRTEQLLQMETNICNTVDPLGGSYYMECLTSELEKRTWEYIQKIEDMGGIVPALESGWVHREFMIAMEEHEKKVNRGEIPVVGVNCHQVEEEPYQFPLFRPNPRAAEIQTEKIEKVKRERDNARVERALKDLSEVTQTDENIMPAVIEAVRAYATLGEICNVWRDIYGLWRIPFGG